MSGLCVVVDRAGIATRAQSVFNALVTGRQTGELIEATPELAIGQCDRFRLQSRRHLTPLSGGLLIAIDGDLLDAGGDMGETRLFIGDLYRRDRMDLLNEVNGSFALAILDPSQRRVTLASDRFGTRPLYLWHSASGLVAASRLGAVLTDGRPRQTLSIRGLLEVAALQRPLGGHTIYTDISCLVGGELVVFEDGRISRTRNWKPRWRASRRSVDDIAEEYAAGMRQAVVQRIKDAKRPALMLSGGLDSRLVLAAATAEKREITCITAVSQENRELRVARTAAEVTGQPFAPCEISPGTVVAHYPEAALATEGLYPAPMNLFALWPELDTRHDVFLHGYAIDYTIRGLYLPRQRFLNAKWPRLQSLSAGDGAAVLRHLTIGDRSQSWRQSVPPEREAAYEASLRAGFDEVIGLCEPETIYDAWDTLAIAPQCRHYTSSALIGMNLHVDQRPVGLDIALMNTYFSIPAAQRAQDVIAPRALHILNPALARLPNANTNLSAGLPAALQVAILVGRAGFKRLGSAFRKQRETVRTEGSWVNHAELFRTAPALRERLTALPRAETITGLSIFEHSQLQKTVDEHLCGTRDHMKFLHMLASLDLWLQKHPYSGVA